MTQPKCAAQFAAETAALGRITSVTLVASGFLALVASGFLALVASGFLALVASGFLIRRGCRGLDVRRGSDLRRFGPRRPRFRGRGRPSACRTRLFFHTYHASGYGRAGIAAPPAATWIRIVRERRTVPRGLTCHSVAGWFGQ